jgi:hypothetical protein
MHFTKLYLAVSLAASALALPTSLPHKRALQFRQYADFQISDGKAGNALSEAQAKFPVSCLYGKHASRQLTVIRLIQTT